MDPSPALPPGVMVSSTFYDLKQVREDLRRFIGDELGYRALLSEHPSFPINPDSSTIANCRERVQRDADVLVLVVGRRYGTLDDHSAQSISNIEYRAAREKGIPIYAFVDRSLLTLLPVWRKSPDADFSGEVDSVKLFEFVRQIRDVDKVWTHEFDRAQQIIDALRIQFAYQHREGLLLRGRFSNLHTQPWLDRLSGETLRIALEQPKFWEYLLFAGALIDHIGTHRSSRRRHALNVPSGLGDDVVDPLNWIQRRFDDAIRVVGSIELLLNSSLQTALGEPGEPGDREAIVFVAEAMSDVYRDALVWAAKIRAANISEAFRPVLSVIVRMLDSVIEQIEALGGRVQEGIATAEATYAATGEKQTLDLTTTIVIPPGLMSEFRAELVRAAGVDLDALED